MPFAIIQSGGSLQLLNDDGVLTTLTLPTNVTLRTNVPPRWEVFGERLILVNTPSRPLTIDATGTVRVLTPSAPKTAPVLSGPASGSLSGTYRAKMTNRILGDDGSIIAESDYSPASAAVTIVSKILEAASLEISPDAISDRPLYRTTTNGEVYFPWTSADGNVITSIRDALSDEGLGDTEGPRLGTPPRLTTIAQFRKRLFGTGDVDRDLVRYTEAGLAYAWPEDNSLDAPGFENDDIGVVGLLPRRDALGVGRRNSLAQITGTGVEDSDGNADLDIVTLDPNVGLESQETAKVFRDAVYFLWKDGVYRWSSRGIECVSDGKEREGRGKVRSWFATDNYFNRDRYPFAFAHIDPYRPCYRLFLCSAGSEVIDQFVEYDVDADRWFGPHSTALFTPTSAFLRTNSANRFVPVIGGPTAVYVEQATRTDGASTPITILATSARHHHGDADKEKYFGKVSIFMTPQAGGTLGVVYRVGDVNASTTTTTTASLAESRQTLDRMGVGKFAQIEFSHAVAGRDVEILGYVIDPAHIIGRR